jgi:hypothetical protein
MDMEDKNISGPSLLKLIRDKRKLFHHKANSKAGYFIPNAILIHPDYYSLLKEEIKTENKKIIFDMEIIETNDISSFKLIKIYKPDECSI